MGDKDAFILEEMHAEQREMLKWGFTPRGEEHEVADDLMKETELFQ